MYRSNIRRKFLHKNSEYRGRAFFRVNPAEFLTIQAKRKLQKAFVFSGEGQDYHQFEMEFPFDETPDQQKAIDDVSHDMERDYSMDRLVCGDVGYGKTEVAMRAACRAVIDHKQVAVLVPTTVLAFQHFNNFKFVIA